MQSADKRYTVVHNLDRAFDHFNGALFAGLLPACVITLHRHHNARGYFRALAFHDRNGAAESTHEIALNPDEFAGRSDAEILSTLVHEMVHLWQQVYGKSGRNKYHNRQWANMMLQIGLDPFNTNDPTKKTGQACSHTILPGARFAVACAVFLAEGPVIHWQGSAGLAGEASPRTRNKVKYTCPGCGCNAWGKPDLHLVCGDCGEEFAAADGAGD